MEFALAVFSAVASTAVPKLLTVINKLKGKPNTDAAYIKRELEFICCTFQDHSPIGRDGNRLWRAVLVQLRCLAYDIEDCIDRFDVNKTTPEEFASEIARLKTRATDTGQQIIRHMSIAESLEKVAPASSIQGQQVPPPALVPQELQVLLGNLDCLLYLCLFPRNHHVRRNPLIRRWLAEGLVQGEQVAVQNLDNLIKFRIITSIQKSNNGKVKRYQPPDEMRQYISQQSMSENFLLFCDDAAKLRELEYARRLSFCPNGASNVGQDLPIDLSPLRTLAVFVPAGASPASYEVILNFAKYKVLRVLDLKECAHLSERHLSDICKQSLMKYLSIGGSIDRIPRYIGDLEQLETLDLSGSEIVTVYKEVLLLPKLKHLLGKFQLSRRDTLLLGWVTSDLEKFLEDKSVLETLAGFVTGERKGFPQLMSLMRRLRKVKIWCKSNASQENLGLISSAITKFIRDGNDASPRSLSIDVQECSGEFLNTLQVHGSLASLKLSGKLSQFPLFVAELSGIEELCLWSTSLRWNDILAELSKLRILKYLKLIEDNLGPIVIRPAHLRSLERICLVSMPSLEITIQAGALPRLVSLHMLCQDLHVIPGTPGIEITHMAGLTEVALHPQVDQGIKDKWQAAANGLPNKPQVVTGIP